MKYLLSVIIVFLIVNLSSAQSVFFQKITNYNNQNSSRLLKQFAEFISIPNLAADTAGIRKNAEFIMSLMKESGIKNIQRLSPITPGAPASVYGDVIVPGAKTTLVFYAHYDGQPVNPTQWAKGLEPFVPKLYSAALNKGGELLPLPENNSYNPEWRLYARSSSDDKAGVFAIVQAYRGLVKNSITPTCNLKFFFEGEEEAGSQHLGEILEKYKELLKSDLWIMCDGPVHQSGKKQIAFGVRGDAGLDITVYGSTRPLHSGHYGNWAPNPALMLAKLLASMKDENGRVTIKGFYDDVLPLSASESEALKNVPSVDDQMKKELSLKTAEMPDKSLSEAINLPSLNINGFQSGNVGKMASNQIPTYATAAIDLRLVLGNDWKKQQDKVIDHIKNLGYFVIDHEPSEEERLNHDKLIKVSAGKFGYNAQRTSMDLPMAKKVIEAVQATTTDKVVLQPTMGGSLPLYLFEKHLNAKTISVPIANHDNNQHAENENIRLKNLFDGIETMASLMMIKN